MTARPCPSRIFKNLIFLRERSVLTNRRSVFTGITFLLTFPRVWKNSAKSGRAYYFSIEKWLTTFIFTNFLFIILQLILSIRPFVMKMESRSPAGTWTPVMRCPRGTPPTSHQGEATPLTLLPLAPIGHRHSQHSRIQAVDTILMVSNFLPRNLLRAANFTKPQNS